MFELWSLTLFGVFQLLRPETGRPEHVGVLDEHATLTDRTHREFGLKGHAQLSHDEDIEGDAESFGNLEANRHTAPGQGGDDDLSAPEVGATQCLGQVTAGVEPIAKPHDHLLGVTCTFTLTRGSHPKGR